MAVVTGPLHDRRTLWRGFLLGVVAALVGIAALAALVAVAGGGDDGAVHGSGVAVTDQRSAWRGPAMSGARRPRHSTPR